MKEGMAPVKALKDKYPDLIVLADSKIIDGGEIECRDICENGADIITVLAVADSSTIKEVVDTAHKFGRKVLADLICVNDIPKRSKEILELGVDYIGVHTGVDMQKNGRTPLNDLRELITVIHGNQVAVAGGVKLNTIQDYTAEKPEIIIAGGALYNAPDIRKAVIEMKEAMKS